MVTRVIRSAEGAEKLASFVSAHTKFPLTVTITQGDPRRNAQNRLAQRWFSDIARQLDDQSHEDVRADRNYPTRIDFFSGTDLALN